MTATLHVLRPREASILAAIADAFVAPAPPLPPVHRTDLAFAVDANLAAAPRMNRVAVRAMLLALELAPLTMGYGHRLRRLPHRDRDTALERLDRGPLAPLTKAVRTLAHLGYYGDPAVLRLLGYDADAVVARGAHLRAAERRW